MAQAVLIEKSEKRKSPPVETEGLVAEAVGD